MNALARTPSSSGSCAYSLKYSPVYHAGSVFRKAGSTTSSSLKDVADHATSEIPRQPRSIHGIRRKARRMAELVTARVRKRIRKGKYEGNDCPSSAHLSLPTILHLGHTHQPKSTK
jgi:hypothetical protein